MIQIKQHQKYTSLVVEISHHGSFLTIDQAFLSKFESFIKDTKTSDFKAIVFHFKANPDKNGNPIAIAGGNLKELNQLLNKADLAKLFFMKVRNFLTQLLKLEPLIITASEGSCIGGGAEWFLHCDYSFLTKSSYLHFKQLEVGLPFGFGGEQQLLKRCGVSTTSQLIFNAKKIQANDAKKLNLIHEVTEASIDSELALFLEQLDRYPIESIHAQKQNLNTLQQHHNESLTNTFMKSWGNDTYRNTLLKFK